MRKSTLVILALLLLLTQVPRLLAAGANNLASRPLISEWETATHQMGLPRCEQEWTTPTAARFTEAALLLNSDYERALINAGRVAWLEGDCSRAQANWERALVIAPQDQVVAFWLFWATGADKDRVPKSLRAEDLAKYAYLAGQKANKTGKVDTAMAWYELSLDLNPNRETASRLTLLYWQEEQVENAVSAWMKVASASPPGDPDHWWALGQAAEISHDWEQALWAYKQGEKLGVSSCDFQVQQGSIFEQLQRWEEAETNYHLALATCPERPEPYLRLGHIYRVQEDYWEALTWYQQAEVVASGDLAPLYYQGMVYYLLDKYVEAQAYLEQALALNPNHAGSNYYLAQTLHDLGELEEAVDLLEHAMDFHSAQPWQWVVQLGEWRLELGDREGALEAYRQALELKPGDEQIEQRIEELTR